MSFLRLALYKGRARLFDRSVQWWTRSPYSHCELILGTNTQGLSVCASSSYIDGGVRIKHMVLDPARWDLLDLPGLSPADARQWFVNHHGQRYDVLGLFGFVLPFVRDDTTRWFCSEACAAAMGLGEPWRYSPGALAAWAQSMSGIPKTPSTRGAA